MSRDLIESLEPRELFAGVILLATGRLGGTTGWMQTMTNDITANLGGTSQVSQYLLTIDANATTEDLYATISRISPTPAPQDTSTGEVIVLIDYYNISANPIYSSTYIGETLADFLMSTPVDGVNLTSLPIQEIGVSRGCGIFDQANLYLGQSGVWVDQETQLDPNPIAAQGDPGSVLYSNVEFSDVYWRNDGSAAQTNDGHAVTGAYNLNVYWLDSEDAGYSTPHLAPSGYYIGTIDQTATYGGEGPIYSEWYGDTPTMPARDATGWIYSDLVGDARPLSGVWAASGGSGTRTSTGTVGSQWGDVSDLALTSGYTISQGDTFNASFIHQDSGGADTVNFYLDTDRNPLDGSFAANLGSAGFGTTANTASASETLSTAGIAPGTYYLVAEVTGSNGQVRYDYSPINKPITITSATTATGGDSSVTGSIFNDTVGNGVAYTGAAGLVGVTVFADIDGDTYQSGDPTAVTDANGDYTLTGLAAGVPVYIGQILPDGYRQTTAPTDPVTLTAGQNSNLAPFGDSQTGLIGGDVSIPETDGAGINSLAGFVIQLTEKIKHGPTLHYSTVTAANGSFSFAGVEPGTKDTIKIVKRKGFNLAKHTKNTAVITVGDGQLVNDVIFSQVPIIAKAKKA